MRRTIFFDMDDTIFDHSAACEVALRSVVVEQSGLQRRPFGEVFTEYGRLLEAIQPEVLAGTTTHEKARDARFVQLFAFCGEEVSPTQAHKVSQGYRSVYQKSRSAVLGVPELLAELDGKVNVGIISNNEKAEQLDKLKAIGLAGKFDLVVTSEEAGSSKPSPGIFSYALDRAGVDVFDAVMVGDNWATDIEGALSRGIPAVWFNRRGEASPRLVDVPQFATLEPTPFLLEALLHPRGAR